MDANVLTNYKLKGSTRSQLNTQVASFTNMVLNLIPAWISNYMPGKMWDEITYPFLNFNGATVEV